MNWLITALLRTIDRSMAIIEFSLKGHILTANNNFLNTLGYRLEDVKGQHHRILLQQRLCQQ